VELAENKKSGAKKKHIQPFTLTPGSKAYSCLSADHVCRSHLLLFFSAMHPPPLQAFLQAFHVSRSVSVYIKYIL
jgi:hypothetical protein